MNKDSITNNKNKIDVNSSAISTVEKNSGTNNGGDTNNGGGGTSGLDGNVPATLAQVDKDVVLVTNQLRTDPKSFIP